MIIQYKRDLFTEWKGNMCYVLTVLAIMTIPFLLFISYININLLYDTNIFVFGLTIIFVWGICCLMLISLSNLFVLCALYFHIRKYGKAITAIFDKEEIREVYSSKKQMVVKLNTIKKYSITKNYIIIIAFNLKTPVLYYSKSVIGEDNFMRIKEYLKSSVK